MAVTGYEFLRAIDLLADYSCQLIQPVVSTTIAAIAAGGDNTPTGMYCIGVQN